MDVSSPCRTRALRITPASRRRAAALVQIRLGLVRPGSPIDAFSLKPKFARSGRPAAGWQSRKRTASATRRCRTETRCPARRSGSCNVARMRDLPAPLGPSKPYIPSESGASPAKCLHAVGVGSWDTLRVCNVKAVGSRITCPLDSSPIPRMPPLFSLLPKVCPRRRRSTSLPPPVGVRET